MENEFKKMEVNAGSHSSDKVVGLTTNTTYLNRAEGRIGFDILGDGPLVVLIPGMGDLRATYRFLAPSLREAGFRVACTDLRGHGDSDSTFKTYGDVETASDVVALIEKLGGPAVVIGGGALSLLPGLLCSRVWALASRRRERRTPAPHGYGISRHTRFMESVSIVQP